MTKYERKIHENELWVFLLLDRQHKKVVVRALEGQHKSIVVKVILSSQRQYKDVVRVVLSL